MLITVVYFLKSLGIEAMFEKMNYSASSSNSCASGIETTIANCSDTKISSTSSHPFKFWHNTCSTPRIKGISPQQITTDTAITISGRGFSSTLCHNKVKLGDHICDVLYSNKTQITCKINITNSPPVNRDLTVSVQVVNRGYALLSAANSDYEKVKVMAMISSMTPQSGSAAGGTELKIVGTGFNAESVIATIERLNCRITSKTYTTIKCVTGKASTLSDMTSKMSLVVDASSALCSAAGNTSSVCDFTYTVSSTPMISSFSPAEISSEMANITFPGNGFGSDASKVDIKIGPASCSVLSISNTLIICGLNGLVAGTHNILLNVFPLGNAWINGTKSVESRASISSLTPRQGSIHGGTNITIIGNGFDPVPGQVTVTIDSKQCDVKSVTFSTVICTSPPGSGQQNLKVRSGSKNFPSQKYTYDTAVTPNVNSLSPKSGKLGQTLTINGSAFHSSPNHVSVTVGGVVCLVNSATITSVSCTLGAHTADNVSVSVHVEGKGHSNSDVIFEYALGLTDVAPFRSSRRRRSLSNSVESGYGGGINITLTGYGFGSDTVAIVCDNRCRIGILTNTELVCEAPAYPSRTPGNDVSCSVTVTSGSGTTETFPNAYTYRDSLTSTVTSVSPSRGGTGGGVRVTINGSGFDTTPGSTVVTIAGIPCQVVTAALSSTTIECITGRSSRTIRTEVRVEVGSKGKALIISNGDFYYVDVWSSRFSWGGKDLPKKGKKSVSFSTKQSVGVDQL